MSLDNLRGLRAYLGHLNNQFVKPESNAKPVTNTQSKKLQAVILAPTVEIPNVNDGKDN